jgi:hypothetical protein
MCGKSSALSNLLAMTSDEKFIGYEHRKIADDSSATTQRRSVTASDFLIYIPARAFVKVDLCEWEN